jgi:ribulose 1,5-bisphosphate carboxylase large subunit-like protein
MGPAAGARALRQAIDAVMAGVPLRMAAENQPELKTAIDLWGISEIGVKGAYDLMQG